MQIINQTKFSDFRLYAESDYSGAMLTIIYSRSKESSTRTLLFAVVELLPTWIESGEFDFAKTFGTKSKFEINVRRVQLSTQDGIEWYLQCRRQAKPELPLNEKERASKMNKNGSRPIEINQLGEEPEFANFVFANQYFWDDSPIWGRYPGGYRWHQLRALSPIDTHALWNNQETARQEAEKWLVSFLPFNIFLRPLALGSVHLILHNPIFRTVRYYPSSDDPKKMLVRLQPGPGKDIRGLIVHLREDRPSGPAKICTFEMLESMAEIEFPNELHSVGIDVVCPIRGLLFHSESAPFIKSISIGMGIITKQRVVNLPRRSKAHGESKHITPVIGINNPIQIGEVEKEQSAISVIAAELSRIESANLGKKLGQQWFEQDRDGATEEIRNLIARAKDDILIVDPYFGQLDLLQFALAVTDVKAKIRILTSAEFLRKTIEVNEKKVHQGDLLLSQLKSVKEQDADLSGIEIRYMAGRRAEIHDRFIKVPEMIWHLGSSLNEFGSRGTMTMRIPNPYPIEQSLEAAWERGCPLEEFVPIGEDDK